MKVEIYEISETKNNKVNYEKLNIELETSPITKLLKAEGINGKIYVHVEEDFDFVSDLIALTNIIKEHDGEEARAFSRIKRTAREDEISKLNQVGIFHPLIDENKLVRYLTEIDNYVNAWVRSSNPIAIVERIFKDAGVKDIMGNPATLEDGTTVVDTSTLEWYDFLQIETNPKTKTKIFQAIAGTVLQAS